MNLVLKIGGAALETPDTLSKCVESVSRLAAEGHSVAVVHGGGAALTRLLGRLGKEATFVDGLRVTDADTRDLALMVLAGSVNKGLAATLSRAGCPAVGLCGGDGLAVRARAKHPSLGFVGEVSSFDPRWIEAIWREGGVPVLSSLAVGSDGAFYNVNADEMAASCAVSVSARILFFLTDVPGVRGAAGTVLPTLDLAEIDGLIRDSHVRGGMLPKLAACRYALGNGVGRVRILPALQADLVPELLFPGTPCGTEVRVA